MPLTSLGPLYLGSFTGLEPSFRFSPSPVRQNPNPRVLRIPSEHLWVHVVKTLVLGTRVPEIMKSIPSLRSTSLDLLTPVSQPPGTGSEAEDRSQSTLDNLPTVVHSRHETEPTIILVPSTDVHRTRFLVPLSSVSSPATQPGPCGPHHSPPATTSTTLRQSHSRSAYSSKQNPSRTLLVCEKKPQRRSRFLITARTTTGATRGSTLGLRLPFGSVEVALSLTRLTTSGRGKDGEWSRTRSHSGNHPPTSK